MEELRHPFEPVYDSQSQVLILGSFPSEKSREEGFYYGHPRNRFWAMLARVYDEPVPVGIEEKKALLLRRHLALWDAAARCRVHGSMDKDIREAVPTDLGEIVSGSAVHLVLCNGQWAGRMFEKYQQSRLSLPWVTLPSTSPANAAWSLEALCEAWKQYLPERRSYTQ